MHVYTYQVSYYYCILKRRYALKSVQLFNNKIKHRDITIKKGDYLKKIREIKIYIYFVFSAFYNTLLIQIY